MKTIAALLAVTLSFSAFAAGVDRRQCRQQVRIAQGVHSGELTRHEVRTLERRESRIDAEIARDRADGPGLTPNERAKIQRQENRLSRDIYRQKHDAQER